MYTWLHWNWLSQRLNLRRSTIQMQPDGKNFCGDIVLDSLNRDEDSKLDQKYEKQISWDLYYEDLKFYKKIQQITTRNSRNCVLVLLLC